MSYAKKVSIQSFLWKEWFSFATQQAANAAHFVSGFYVSEANPTRGVGCAQTETGSPYGAPLGARSIHQRARTGVQPFLAGANLAQQQKLRRGNSATKGRYNLMIILILVVLLLLFGYGGYRVGPGVGYYGGGGISLILLIVIVLLLLRVI